jgi:hypothetical protein
LKKNVTQNYKKTRVSKKDHGKICNENNEYCMTNCFSEVKMKRNKKRGTPCMGKKKTQVKNEDKKL